MFLRSGQVTILALLLGLFGLTIGLSVASRSLSDLRQASVVDQGTKTLAAAEAGIQYSLNQLSIDSATALASCNSGVPATPANISLNGIQSNGVKYSVCSNTASYVAYPAVAQDDVVQVNITGLSCNVKTFSVLWKNSNAAVEIIKIDKNGNATRFAYNGTGVTAGNNFAPAVSASSANCVVSGANPCADATFNNGSCTGLGVIPYDCANDTFLRVKPIYASSDIAVCSQESGNSPGRLDLLYYQVTATATTVGGVTRKVQTSQIYNFLPAVFDNVFYSGGGITK